MQAVATIVIVIYNHAISQIYDLYTSLHTIKYTDTGSNVRVLITHNDTY